MSREQERRLDNVLRFGAILAVDYQKATARVQSGNIQTDFLLWSSVNNCTEGMTNNEMDKFLRLHAEAVKRLDFALKIRGIGGRWITDTRKKRPILGDKVSFMENSSIRFNGVEVEIC